MHTTPTRAILLELMCASFSRDDRPWVRVSLMVARTKLKRGSIASRISRMRLEGYVIATEQVPRERDAKYKLLANPQEML